MDKASFFRNDDGSLTQLGKRLKFLGISFVFANTPEAKGKIERIHQVWQDRLPAYAAREKISQDVPLDEVNATLDSLVDHRNGFERHRDLGDVPLNAWERAIGAGLCKIRQPPLNDPMGFGKREKSGRRADYGGFTGVGSAWGERGALRDELGNGGGEGGGFKLKWEKELGRDETPFFMP